MESSEKPNEAPTGLPPTPPGFIEQDHGDEIDNIVPTRGYEMTPMVGLGGSAEAIPALNSFFDAMPHDSGMIFIVVLHLSPAHQSSIDSLLARHTKMPVMQAENGQKVLPNHVYVIPPGKFITTVDGHLKLSEIDQERGKRVAVDLFFRSLADTHGPHAAAVILSGADGDGAIGIKRIKERGGLTIAQDPDEAEYSGMPRSAIETGMVDWVLEISQMPTRLMQYLRHESKIRLPPEEGPVPVAKAELTPENGEAILREVLVFLRMRTGRDFSYYKRATILRRIARRMQVNNVDDLNSYLTYLRTHPGESGALLQDLLISVTNFFRDRDAFEVLRQHIPTLFNDKTQSDSLRVWVPACATGEEAYSIAILLLEHARQMESPPALQVFACDLDDEAIQIARAGKYPEAISADVSEERLRKFFVKEHDGYRVRRELREMVLFASHDLLKDAPFSRMDLISCRNLLIYLNRDAQKRVFDIFHFALKPGGLMLLGTSEAVEDGSTQFRIIDKKHRLYAYNPTSRSGLPLPSGPGTLLRTIESHQMRAAPVVHGKRFVHDAAVPFHGELNPNFDRSTLADIHLKLIERYSPPSVIVNAEHEILHLSEHAGMFLGFVGGEPTSNLLRVVNPALRVELRTALFRAAEANATVEVTAPAVSDESTFTVLSVSPAQEIAPGCLLVIFKPAREGSETRGVQAELSTNSEPAVRHLERELEQIKSQLRDTVEQYEASTEELKASNEELQAMNEELRSATEELETSREELQSINEELTTVNSEMKGKVDELAHANSDLQNLMASTSIATVFLDRELAITRYTPNAAGIFNMIPSDIGRPLEHLKPRLEYPDLIADAERVLRTLVPIEREVRAEQRWYLARFQPYRTLEDHIAGAVLTLVDVTERNQATQALRRSEERMRMLIESAKDYAIFTTDPDRRIDSWNTGAEAVFGYTESEIVGQSADILFTVEDRAKGDPEREVLLAKNEGRAGNERWHLRKDGSIFYGSGSVMPLRDEGNKLVGYVKIMRDLTESKRNQEALQEQMNELTRFNAIAVGRETRMIELKQEINELLQQLGKSPKYQSPEQEADREE